MNGSQLEAKLQEMPLAKKDARTCTILFIPLQQNEIDKGSRINISSEFTNTCQFRKRLLLSASSNRIEIWRRTLVCILMKLKKTDELAETMIDFGF